MSDHTIAPMTREDFTAFWPVFHDIVKAEQTYAIDPSIDFDSAYTLWCEAPAATRVIKNSEGEILGAYYLKANAAGPGNHVCNCGYMVSPAARGQGVARTLCEHSQTLGKALGFSAMQFNAVVASNEVAVALWQRLGFAIVGTVPGAFRHSTFGPVDTYVMHKFL
ncbi:GNAT family N-acetyltransferase [Halomonas sp. HMF6819]|uniref:GNAT family N-acetyltransferase n=1 Tax=Halomonas sp. HMF6819 TaxID=3373085 RepID=UPI003798F67D